MATKQPKDPAKLTFEQAIERLESIIDQVESGEIGLEDALKHYESGTALVKRCRAILDKTEQRIKELAVDEEGKLSVESSAPD